jgi:predicted nucleotidyltransferase
VDNVVASVTGYFASNRPADVLAAYVFGSHAGGRAHRESDVDVAVLLDHGISERAIRSLHGVRLNADLVAATHVNAVDVVILNDAPAELSAAVVRRGVRVYCADEQADHDFVRTAQLLDCDLRPFLIRARRRKLEGMIGGRTGPHPRI